MSKIIEKTSPDGKDWNAETVKEWLHGYHGIRNVVETIMNLQDEYDEQTQLLIDSCRSGQSLSRCHCNLEIIL